jgi:hypothetical protein
VISIHHEIQDYNMNCDIDNRNMKKEIENTENDIAHTMNDCLKAES